MDSLGIASGFATAFFASLSYLMSRYVVGRKELTPTALAGVSHFILAIISLIVLPFSFYTPQSGWGAILLPLLASSGFYFTGQVILFRLLSVKGAEIVSPLLGLKILIVTIMGLYFGEGLNGYKIVGVALSIGAVWLLRGRDRQVDLRTVLTVLLICLLYALCDFNVKRLIVAFDPEASLKAVLMATALSYIVCGLMGFLFIREARSMTVRALPAVTAYSVFWFASMCFLFLAIAKLGVVRANIVQATRGVMSVGLAALLTKSHFYAFEKKVSALTRLRQAAAAGLMVAAIFLYFR